MSSGIPSPDEDQTKINEPYHDWHGDDTPCECITMTVDDHLFIKDPAGGWWHQAEAEGYRLLTLKTMMEPLLNRIHELAETIDKQQLEYDRMIEHCYVIGEGWPLDDGTSPLRHTRLTAAQIRPYLHQALRDAFAAAEAAYPEIAS